MEAAVEIDQAAQTGQAQDSMGEQKVARAAELLSDARVNLHSALKAHAELERKYKLTKDDCLGSALIENYLHHFADLSAQGDLQKGMDSVAEEEHEYRRDPAETHFTIDPLQGTTRYLGSEVACPEDVPGSVAPPEGLSLPTSVAASVPLVGCSGQAGAGAASGACSAADSADWAAGAPVAPAPVAAAVALEEEWQPREEAADERTAHHHSQLLHHEGGLSQPPDAGSQPSSTACSVSIPASGGSASAPSGSASTIGAGNPCMASGSADTATTHRQRENHLGGEEEFMNESFDAMMKRLGAQQDAEALTGERGPLALATAAAAAAVHGARAAGLGEGVPDEDAPVSSVSSRRSAGNLHAWMQQQQGSAEVLAASAEPPLVGDAAEMGAAPEDEAEVQSISALMRQLAEVKVAAAVAAAEVAAAAAEVAAAMTEAAEAAAAEATPPEVAHAGKMAPAPAPTMAAGRLPIVEGEASVQPVEAAEAWEDPGGDTGGSSPSKSARAPSACASPAAASAPASAGSSPSPRRSAPAPAAAQRPRPGAMPLFGAAAGAAARVARQSGAASPFGGAPPSLGGGRGRASTSRSPSAGASTGSAASPKRPASKARAKSPTKAPPSATAAVPGSPAGARKSAGGSGTPTSPAKKPPRNSSAARLDGVLRAGGGGLDARKVGCPFDQPRKSVRQKLAEQAPPPSMAESDESKLAGDQDGVSSIAAGPQSERAISAAGSSGFASAASVVTSSAAPSPVPSQVPSASGQRAPSPVPSAPSHHVVLGQLAPQTPTSSAGHVPLLRRSGSAAFAGAVVNGSTSFSAAGAAPSNPVVPHSQLQGLGSGGNTRSLSSVSPADGVALAASRVGPSLVPAVRLGVLQACDGVLPQENPQAFSRTQSPRSLTKTILPSSVAAFGGLPPPVVGRATAFGSPPPPGYPVHFAPRQPVVTTVTGSASPAVQGGGRNVLHL